MNDKNGHELTTSQRRRLQQLGALAHDRELSTELARVEASFRRWRAGEIDAHTLTDGIHQFNQGPARELFLKYETAKLDFVVAAGIHRGLITQDEAGPEIIDVLKEHLAFMREREDDEETVDR